MFILYTAAYLRPLCRNFGRLGWLTIGFWGSGSGVTTLGGVGVRGGVGYFGVSTLGVGGLVLLLAELSSVATDTWLFSLIRAVTGLVADFSSSLPYNFIFSIYKAIYLLILSCFFKVS